VSTAARPGPVIAVTGLAFEASIAAGFGVTVLRGDDRPTLRASLQRAVARGTRGIISFGVAGGLDPGLEAGQCVVAATVVTASERYATCERWSQHLLNALPQARPGAIVGVDNVVACPDAKRALRADTGATAVDMESHVAAGVAAQHGVPFAAIRIIVDPAYRPLPPAALVPLCSDGTPHVKAILRSLASEPRQFMALMRVAFDARAARAALLRGRRLLGLRLAFPDFGEHLLDVSREDVLGGPLAVEGNFGSHRALGAYSA
jgi:adenosylhomocysteine nucleosidase